MPSAKKKSSKPTTCPECGGVDLVRKITTYPVQLSGPLEGKQVHVGRVALHECLTCGHLMPTLLAKPKSTAMSIWASVCSSDTYTNRLLPLCHWLLSSGADHPFGALRKKLTGPAILAGWSSM